MSKPLRFIAPALPVLRKSPPGGAGWRHEMKFDGWRVQLHAGRHGTRLLSRHGHDITRRFAPLTSVVAALPRNSIIDAELVAYGPDGLPSFDLLSRRGVLPLRLWAFDLLVLSGRALVTRPWHERRARLAAVVARLGREELALSEDFEDAARLLAAVEQLGGEGIVSKPIASLYRSGAACGWIKVKTEAWRSAHASRAARFNRGR